MPRVSDTLAALPSTSRNALSRNVPFTDLSSIDDGLEKNASAARQERSEE